MTYRALLIVVAASACAAPVSEDETTSALHDATTVVALTFDDTFADNFQVGAIAAARGMRATFYVNSSRLGTAGYLSAAQLRTLEDQGHEIGGHTLTHARLTAVSADEARREVCNDRAALLDAGFVVTTFAYPFAANNATVEQIVDDCGYNAARDVGGLTEPGSCSGCPYANPIPPPAPYALRSHDSVNTSTTLADLQGRVIRAEQNGGGFVPFVFHHVCDGCSPEAISPATLAAFLDWLEARAPATQVGTVHQVIGGSVQPPVRVPPDEEPPPPTGNLLRNPSLETDADGNQVPDCWQRGGYGTNTASYALVSDAFDGTVAQRITISSWSSGGRRLVSAQDQGACAPAVTPGRSYTMTAYYKATTQPRFSVYYRTTSGSWVWFAQSPLQPTSSTYRQATYTTPALPADATAISIGLTIFNVGTITIDAHTLVDASAPPPPPPTDTTPPALALACNGAPCATTPYPDPVTVSLSASDAGSGVREIRYTTNGSDPATGTLYTAPFTVSTSSTVRATAVDNAGNRTSQSRTITIDDTEPPPPPPTGNLLKNPSLETDADGNQVPDCWQRGGYGTNAASYALVGDAFEGAVAQQITITSWSSGGRRLSSAQDAGACAPAVTAGRSYVVTAQYKATIQPRVSVYVRSTSGSWRWFAESALLPASSSYRQATYTTPPMPADATHISIGVSIFGVGSLTTDAYALVDASAEPPPPPADTTPPALAIACNGSPCATTAYGAPVQVSLSATDASGIAELRYTVDGSDPATGTPYTAPFTVSASATVRATAVDTAGNRATASAAITIDSEPPPPGDTTPPALAIACDGSPCATTAYGAPVEVSLTASDASGIAELRYTVDGSDPATGTPYTAPFTLAASATVRATAVDTAGNRATQSTAVTIDDGEPPPPPSNLLQNASLEVDANGDQIPDCWQRGGYGTNSATYALVGDAYDGAVAQQVTITSWSSGGRRLNSAQDAGACAPAVTPGTRYTVTARYKATIAPRVSIYVRSTSGAWRWLAESAPLPTATAYTQATYTTPPLPADATHISVGVSIFGVGSITTDAYTLVAAP